LNLTKYLVESFGVHCEYVFLEPLIMSLFLQYPYITKPLRKKKNKKKEEMTTMMCKSGVKSLISTENSKPKVT